MHTLASTRSRGALRPIPDARAGRPVSLDLDRKALRCVHDVEQHTVWAYMRPRPRACFTPQLLTDILAMGDAIVANPDVEFLVFASDVPGVYNLGGDLSLFRELSQAHDEAALLRYAEHCVQAVHRGHVGFGQGTTTIALVQGDALGGGLEAALACHIVVAEKGTRMGFPEILFNLFPGMGAYSLVARKVGPRLADKLIGSGCTILAEEMHEYGLVDYLAEPGRGDWVVHNLISDRRVSHNGHRALQRAKLHTPFTVPIEELLAVTREWVAATRALTERDLKLMERLVRAQDRLAEARSKADAAIATAS